MKTSGPWLFLIIRRVEVVKTWERDGEGEQVRENGSG